MLNFFIFIFESSFIINYIINLYNVLKQKYPKYFVEFEFWQNGPRWRAEPISNSWYKEAPVREIESHIHT